MWTCSGAFWQNVTLPQSLFEMNGACLWMNYCVNGVQPGYQSLADSGLCGLCDIAMVHIKKGSIEICRGSKGCHGDHSTSNNNKTGWPSDTAILKLSGSRDMPDKIKAKTHTSHLIRQAHCDNRLRAQQRLTWPCNLPKICIWGIQIIKCLPGRPACKE